MARDSILRDLRSLGPRKLERTLGLLDADERTQVLGLVKGDPVAASQVPFDALVGLSPWLLKAIDTGATSAGRRTPAAARAAAAALAELSSKPSLEAGAGDLDSSTFIGRMLMRRSARRRRL